MLLILDLGSNRHPVWTRVNAIGDVLKSSSGRALTRDVVRGMFGMLKKGF
jgi:hypothetical protein